MGALILKNGGALASLASNIVEWGMTGSLMGSEVRFNTSGWAESAALVGNVCSGNAELRLSVSARVAMRREKLLFGIDFTRHLN